MANVSWKANVSGDWQDPGVWQAAAPTATSNVSISTASPQAITHNGGTDTVSSLTVGTDTLTLGAGSLTISGNLAVAAVGSLVVSGGTLSLGAGGTVAGALSLSYGKVSLAKATTLAASGTIGLGGTIDGPGTLATSGTSTLANQLLLGGGLAWTNTSAFDTGASGYSISAGDAAGGTAAITNAPGATFAFTSDAGILNNQYLNPAQTAYLSGSSSFANAGTLSKTAGSGTSNIYSALTSTGTVSVTSGTLELDGGATLSGTVGTGIAGTLAFAIGNNTVTGFTKASNVVVGGGSLAVAAASTYGSLTVNGGAVSLGAASSFTSTLTVYSGALSLAASSTVTGVLSLSYGRVSLAKTVSLTASNAATLAGTIDGPGTLATSGTSTLTNQLLLGGGLTWTNTGAFDSGASGYSIAAGDAAGGTAAITNAAGATFAFTSDAGIVNNQYLNPAQTAYLPGSSTFANAGTLAKTAGIGTSNIYSALTSTGTVSVTSGTLELDGGATLSGTVGTGLAGTLAFNGSATVTGFTKASNVVVGGGSLAVAAASTYGSLTVNNGTVSLGAASSFTSALTVYSGALSLAASSTVTGLLSLSYGRVSLAKTVSLTASNAATLGGTIDGPGTLVTGGTSTLGSQLLLGGGLAWTNTSAFDTGATGYSISAGDGAGGTAKITNAAGATFAFTSDAGILNNQYLNPAQTGYLSGSSTFANAGTLAKTAGTGTSNIYSALTSTGTISVTSGTLELDGGATLSGTVGTGIAGTLAFNAGSTTVTGFTQASNVVVGGGSLAVAAASTYASLTVNGGTVSLGAASTFTTALTVYSGTLSMAAGSTVAGALSLSYGVISLAKNVALTASGSATLAGTIDGPGTLATSGTSTLTNQLILGGGLAWTNTGAFDSGVSGYSISAGDAAGGTAAITNAASATFAFTSDGGIVNNQYLNSAQTAYLLGSSTFANAGTLAKTAGTGTSAIASTVTNIGTITATSGTLELDAGGALGGTMGASGSGALALGVGAFTVASPTQTIGGTLHLLSGRLTVASGANLTLAGNAALEGTTIDGPGTLTSAGTAKLLSQTTIGGGLVWNNTGAFSTGVQDYMLLVGDIAGGTATISNAAGGTFGFTSNSGILNNAFTDTHGSNQTGSSTFANAGTLSKTGVLGTSQVYSTLTNTGSIVAGIGVIELDGGATLNGTVSSNGGTVLLNANGFATTTLLTVANNPTSTALTLASGQTWTNSGAIVAGGRIQLGNVAGGSLATLTNQLGATIALTTDSANVNSAGTTTINNAGTIAKTSGVGTSTVSATIANTGTIDAASGTLKVNSVNATGILQIEGGAALELNTFAATQAIVFNGAGATLKLDKTASVTQTLTGFGVGDRLDLVTASGATATVAGNTLSVVAAAKTYTFKSSLSLVGDVVVAGVDASGGGTVFTLYHQAAPSLHTPEPVAFGNHHLGELGVVQAIAITNTGVAGGFSEKLNATLSGAAGDIAATGAFSGLAGQATDATSLVVTLNTATTGGKSGTASIAFVSDGTGIDGQGTSTLASQAVTASGTVYMLAAPVFAATTIDFGAARVAVGGTLAGPGLTLANGTAANAYQESLTYTASAAGAFSPTAAGAQTLVAGGAGTVAFILSTTNAGNFTGSAGTVALASTGAGTSGLADTALPSKAIVLNGKVYATAVAQIGGTTIDFGITHVSANAFSQAVTVGNVATGALIDLLAGGTVLSTTGTLGFSLAGLASGVASGQSGAVQAREDATLAGSFSGSVVLGFTSHDGTLADVAANAVTLTTTGIVDNYAAARFKVVSGGTLGGTGAAFTLDLGSVAVGGAALSAQLGIANAAVGQSDLLAGSFSFTGASAFSNSGFVAFAGVAAGGTATGDGITLSSATAGVFTETFTLVSSGSNASGYNGKLADQKLTVTGTIVATGQTYALTAAPMTITGTTGNDTITAAGYALNSRDHIDGGAGVNTLQLTGAGTFDLGAPRTLLNIQAVGVAESVPGTTVFMRDALGVTLTVASGPAGSGITIYGGADASTIYLGSGLDTVVLDGAAETIVANAAGGTALVQGSAATAGTLVTGSAAAATTLELRTGGTAALNAGDVNLRVVLDAATNLALGKGSFLTAQGSAANDTLTAGGVNQTLTGGGGSDTLVGSTLFGDVFRDTVAHFSTDLLKGFGGSDLVDATDLSFASLGALKVTTAGTGATATTTLGGSDGSHVFALKLAGGYALTNFTAASDGHGGTQFGFH